MNEKLEKLVKTVFDIKCLANEVNKRDDIDIVQREKLLSAIKDLQSLGLKLIKIRNELEEINDNIDDGVYNDGDWKHMQSIDCDMEDVGMGVDDLTKFLGEL